jgi:[methyl-Co(III) methanol-specific corrinoid protein]:coenzyme M methyltransferase
MNSELESIDCRTRLLLALEGQPVDRPPVICAGGMMTMATRSAMQASGCFWPAAHADALAMAGLVLATREETGLECLSVPFCMTVEAEALGCKIDMGSETILPHVVEEAISTLAVQVVRQSDSEKPAGGVHETPPPLANYHNPLGELLNKLPAFDPEKSGRAPVVLEALRILKSSNEYSHGRDARAAAEHLPYPIIGAVVGPVSLAATVMQAEIFLRYARRQPEAAEQIIEAMEAVILKFARAQHAAGADCILLAEPTGTGEILGAKHFRRLALPALGRLLRALRELNIPAILHICGEVQPIFAELSELAGNVGSLALSVDAMVSGRRLKKNLPACIRIGNIDPFLLERGKPSAIENTARRAAREFHIVSPACGLSPLTPAENLQALMRAVRG